MKRLPHALEQREDLLASLLDCQIDACIAAKSNASFSTNPYAHSSRLWGVWVRSYNAELQRIVDARAVRHERELAERCLRDGELCAGSERLDMAEPQMPLWQRVVAWFFKTKG
jgi:hypothetical protein